MSHMMEMKLSQRNAHMRLSKILILLCLLWGYLSVKSDIYLLTLRNVPCMDRWSNSITLFRKKIIWDKLLKKKRKNQSTGSLSQKKWIKSFSMPLVHGNNAVKNTLTKPNLANLSNLFLNGRNKKLFGWLRKLRNIVLDGRRSMVFFSIGKIDSNPQVLKLSEK